MVCPACGAQSDVVDTRSVDDGRGIRRRRQCRACGYRFTSYEYVVGASLSAFVVDAARASFIADLRGVIARHEGGAIPRAGRRWPVAAAPVEAEPAKPTPAPAPPVKGLRERLKERRQTA